MTDLDAKAKQLLLLRLSLALLCNATLFLGNSVIGERSPEKNSGTLRNFELSLCLNSLAST